MTSGKKIDGHHVTIAQVRGEFFVWVDGAPLTRPNASALPPEEQQARFSKRPWAVRAAKMELERRRKPLTLT